MWIRKMTAVLLAMAVWHEAPAQIAMDTSFNGNGWQAIPFEPLDATYNWDVTYASCPGPNGTQIVSGMVRGGSGSNWMGVVRLRWDGSLDPTFGTAGRQYIALDTGGVTNDSHVALCVGGGRTVIARILNGHGGVCPYDNAECTLQLLRIDDQGQLDASFGTGGVTVLDLDTVRGGLASAKFLLGLNRAANGQLFLTGSARLAPANAFENRPFVARFSADGVLAGVSIPDLPGLSGLVSASAADYGPSGEVWLVGEGKDANGYFVYYLSVLDAATLQPTATIRGSGGDYALQGARMLRPGVLVSGAVYRPFGASGPFAPRLVVFRQGGISTLDLPPSAPIDGVITSVASSKESIMSLDGTHVLYSASVSKKPVDAWSTYPGMHVALARIGDSAAQDAALVGDAATLSYRSPDVSCAGHAGDQTKTRVSLWNGVPVLVGSALRTCNPGTNADWLIARFKADYLFAQGFD